MSPSPSWLDRARTVAPPGYNRWLVPPAALAIHLSVGQAYAFSVFVNPLSQMYGSTLAKGKLPAHHVMGDWTSDQALHVFSLAIVFLGLSAALFGRWMEKAGPRQAMLASALCFGSGFFVAALGVGLHLLWLVYLGYGVLSGIGLGLGYISPVSTLIKWFPDRPGLATGLAIMGFGGGAMIGSPLAVNLMAHFKTASDSGIVQTLMIMGAAYFVFMLFGVFTVRVPAEGWEPAGYVPVVKGALVTTHGVHAAEAVKTPQFWLLWGVLFCNVTAGIGLIAVASPMIQALFAGHVTKEAAGGFVGLISLFNLAGRLGWSSLSDKLGRRSTYFIYFVLGAALYALVPLTAGVSLGLFVAACLVIISMYGGGFAAAPAYLRDLFGTLEVGAIHGRLLTAWSAAGVAGPSLFAALTKTPNAASYTSALHVMAGLLVIGLVCNFFIRPVAAEHHAAAPAAA